MAAMDSLKQELEECQRLRSQAVSTRIQSLLGSHATTVEREIKRMEEDAAKLKAAAASSTAISSSTTASGVRIIPKDITTFSFDQSAKFFRIYTSVKDCGGLSAENCELICQTNSLELYVHAPNGNEFRLIKRPLAGDIDPAASTIKVKPDGSIVVSLAKKSSETWPGLLPKEEKKPLGGKKPDLSADPSAGIMDMMKQLYEDGDDEMKRTITKAWSESQSGKKPMDF
eukprot:NODE_3192_length_1028_cov_19.152196_g2934_i0.p1 GENE.NODE_3192_length_1028_cov_19.152196_g2934_i0~~NODE_3192_length_1028_cov_19.152196_g2934_i0.p1  ORF type:complete len:258 (-),score=77.31 NODE_3192_length_1028_cov_19.152196_g2934_i0:254-937(-)